MNRTAILITAMDAASPQRSTWASFAAGAIITLALVVITAVGRRRDDDPSVDDLLLHGHTLNDQLFGNQILSEHFLDEPSLSDDGHASRTSADRASGSARVDAVTGLLNRDGLVGALSGATHGSDRNGVAILLVHLDRLDLINGRLGRAVGDQVLRVVANRIRPGDRADAVVARISGATFAALQHTVTDAEAWAEQLAETIVAPLTVEGISLRISCASVLVTTDGFHHDAETLLGDAEHATRRLASTGRRTVEHVRLELTAGTPDSVSVAAQVQEAVAFGHITADYQPIIDLQTMEPVGVEALARWRGAAPGLEGPAEFLEVVRALGLCNEVFDTILRQVCADFAAGPAAERGWWVSVNIGIDDCSDQTLPARISTILAETGLEPERLVLEVSERVIPDPAVERALRNIADIGVGLAIDDFGSGWSSLAQLRSLPVDLIKIDRSLVNNPSAADAQVVMAAIALAGALGLRTLAEGVECGEDLLMLCVAECTLGQGFWWSEADTLDAIIARFPEPTGAAPELYAPVFDHVAPAIDQVAPVLELPVPPAESAADPGGDAQVIDLTCASSVPPGETPDGDVVHGDASSWLDLSDDQFLARLRSTRSATAAHAPPGESVR